MIGKEFFEEEKPTIQACRLNKNGETASLEVSTEDGEKLKDKTYVVHVVIYELNLFT